MYEFSSKLQICLTLYLINYHNRKRVEIFSF